MKTLLLGDLSPTAETNPLFITGDAEKLFTDTLSLFKGNDVNFLNLECALTEYDKDIKKFGPPLKASSEVAQTLKNIGVNYCGLSNNHIFDYGIKGATDTMEALDKAGIVYTGFGENYEDSRKNLIIEKGGERICIIAVCEHEYSYALEDRMGSRPFDEYDTMKDIREAKAKNDRVIVIYHGGKEHCRYPSPRFRRLCHAMTDCGADIVLGQHSHCIGSYEQVNGCHILYGQGNFHFIKVPGMVMPETWNGSLAVRYDTKTNEIEFVPIVNVSETGIGLAKGEEREKILADFAERNKTLQNGEWKKHWHEFCLSMSGLYTRIIKDACNESSTQEQNDLFGHFLDCEAHTDVWRELFPTYNQTNEK